MRDAFDVWTPRFDFSRQRTGVARDELSALCRSVGLTESASRLIVHVWVRGVFHGHHSTLASTPKQMAEIMKITTGHALRVRKNLVRDGYIDVARRGRRANWEAFHRPAADTSSWHDDACVSVVTEGSLRNAERAHRQAQTRAQTSAQDGAPPQYSEPKNSIPTQNSARSTEGEKKRLVWGFAVERPDLESQSERLRLFEHAKRLNPDVTDADLVGFVAVCLRAIAEPNKRRKRVNKPGGFVLRMVERCGWRIRGRGGVDVEFLEAATEQCRAGGIECDAAADRWPERDQTPPDAVVRASEAVAAFGSIDVDSRLEAGRQLAALQERYGR